MTERWTIKKLKEIDDVDFAIAILNEKAASLTNPNAPLTDRIEKAVRGLRKMDESIRKARETASYYVVVDGAHHKDYGLNEIVKILGGKPDRTNEGIPP